MNVSKRRDKFFYHDLDFKQSVFWNVRFIGNKSKHLTLVVGRKSSIPLYLFLLTLRVLKHIPYTQQPKIVLEMKLVMTFCLQLKECNASTTIQTET